MQTSLQAIAIKAGERPKHRFQNLYKELNMELLWAGYERLNRKAAPGVDGQTWKEYQNELLPRLSGLVSRLKEGRYKTQLIKRVYIPKGNGKERPLGIPALEDKVVQQSAATLLQSIFETDFLDCSYGYRPKRSAHEAIHSLNVNLQYGKYGYVVEADIKGFFDCVDHDWLLTMLEQRIDDRAFLKLIRKWLKAGIMQPDGRVERPEEGTPQGGLVSPVLANIYLHYVLDIWFEKKVKPNLQGEALLVRYADDFVCAFRYRKDAERFYRTLPKRLGKFGLELSPEKTRLMRFSRFHPSGKRRINFLGFELNWGRDRQRRPRLHRRTAKKKLRQAVKGMGEWIKQFRHLLHADFCKALNRRLRGHYQYFGLVGNSRQVWLYYKEVIERVYKWLNRRSQRRSYTWAGLNEMLRQQGILKPKVRKLNLPRTYLVYE